MILPGSITMITIILLLLLVALLAILAVLYFLSLRGPELSRASTDTATDAPLSPTSNLSYDVFFSFYNKDISPSFIFDLRSSLVQKQIDVFIDHVNVENGSTISSHVFKAIQESRVALILLSSNYASSWQCLDELVNIITCKETMDQKVIPVFYDTDPFEVRWQTGKFGKAIVNHEKRFEQSRVEKWKKSLTSIANLQGFHVKNRLKSEIIPKLAKEVLKALNKTSYNISKDLVGMSSRVEKFLSYLDLEANDVRTIGICGMGGVGKTVLAQEVFREICHEFEASCFIANVSDNSKEHGLVYLQKHLLNNLLDFDADILDIDQGIVLLRKRLHSKKVLIILDDVASKEELEALVGNGKQLNHMFGSGSRVIVSTRNMHLLKVYEVKIMYKVEVLTKEEARQLFCLIAFKGNDPPSGYGDLCDSITTYTGGVPLALVTLANLLYARSLEDWKSALDKLKSIPDESIMGPLRTSFDSLDVTEKEIFLDIACFFNGDDVYHVKKILDSCGFYPNIGITVLFDKCLVDVVKSKLWMHDLLKELGRNIIYMESPKNPGSRSRLWYHEDAYHVLLKNKGTNTIQGIFLCLPKEQDIHLQVDPFSKMRNLRLLKIYNVRFPENHAYNLSDNLRVLEWHGYPSKALEPSFQPHNLVELNLSNSYIEKLWNENVYLEKLILLDLSNCTYLTKTPDFSMFPNLEKLILEGCKKLIEVHSSVRDIQHLVLLNLKDCKSLKRLPDSINLESLRFFILSGCSELTEFPKLVENMENLLELHLDGTNLFELPVSVEHFTGLNLLDLRDCKNLSILPSFMENLPSSVTLMLEGCSVRDQPPENLKTSGTLSDGQIPTKFRHDVFLILWDEEPQLGFMECLDSILNQNGITTCMAKEELDKEISIESLQAIEKSKLVVIIFSRNYAYSTQSFNGFLHIAKCKKMGQVVFPVFYNVDTAYIEEKICMQKDQLDMKQVNEWREALAEASVAGLQLNNWPMPTAIQEIARGIANMLQYPFLSCVNEDLIVMDSQIEKSCLSTGSADVRAIGTWEMGGIGKTTMADILQYPFLSRVNEDLIGMDSQVEMIESYLSTGSADVRAIGIWGMGGIGKTTIAEETFRKIRYQFEACCFIANVREKSEKYGLVYLQKLLCKNLLVSDTNIQNVDQGIDLLRKRLSSKKVLIILDDVNDLMKIKALSGMGDGQNSVLENSVLGTGSRVIITTRDKNLLKLCGVNSIYEVEKLTDTEAHHLFYRKAFKQDHPVNDYKDMCEKVIHYASGLPLALAVSGSFLYGKNLNEWLCALAKLEEVVDGSIFPRLQLSFDELEDIEREIFLDIACFFNGEDQFQLEKIFRSSCFHPDISIRVLVEKSLVVIKKNKLWMHDVLQRLGWHIVYKEAPLEPGKRSRLWLHKEVFPVLIENKGTDAVRGMSLSLPLKTEIHLNADPFSNMHNLRLLKICNMNFCGCIEYYFPSELRVLEWHFYPLKSLPSSFQPHKLVELNLSNSYIEELWSETFHLEELTLVNFSNCRHLKKIPDFSLAPNLERLILEDCKMLSEIHSSIGNLQQLVVLSLKGCESLERIPHSISLKSLQKCVLSGCSKLDKFSEIEGNMEHLSELHLDGTAIKEMPISVGFLTFLVLLNLRDCKDLLSLPKVLCNLTSLVSLNLSGCLHLEQLPENIGNLKHLQELDVSGTAIREAPSSFRLLLATFSDGIRIWTSEESEDTQVWNEDKDWLKHPFSIHKGNIILDPKFIKDQIHYGKQFEIRFPYVRLPEWWSHLSIGSSILVKLPPDCEWIGLALFVVFEIHKSENFDETRESEGALFDLYTNLGPLENPLFFQNLKGVVADGSYGFCCYSPRGKFTGQINKADVLDVYVSVKREDVKVKRCGIHLIMKDDVVKFCQDLTLIANMHLDLKF